MKGLLLLLALAALSSSNEASVIQEQANTEAEVQSGVPVNPSDLSIGYVGMYYRLLYRETIRVTGRPNEVQTQDVTYEGRPSNQIAAIRANEQGSTQSPSATLVAGGLNGNTATVRLTSARGAGYHYTVSFWGR